MAEKSDKFKAQDAAVKDVEVEGAKKEKSEHVITQDLGSINVDSAGKADDSKDETKVEKVEGDVDPVLGFSTTGKNV